MQNGLSKRNFPRLSAGDTTLDTIREISPMEISKDAHEEETGGAIPFMRKYRSFGLILLTYRGAIMLYLPSSMYDSYCTEEQKKRKREREKAGGPSKNIVVRR